MNNLYAGYHNSEPEQDWYRVSLNGGTFDPAPSLAIRGHSPDGFSWGYHGSGPAQLALGILLNEFGAEIANELYQDFKNEVIANLPNDNGTSWELTSQQVKDWYDQERHLNASCNER